MVSMRVFAATVAALILVSAFSGFYIYTLMGRIADLESQLSDWMEKYRQLDADYRELAERYTALNDQYNQLRAEHEDLQSRYEGLSKDYSYLKPLYEDLLRRYLRLMADYADLSDQCRALYLEYLNLRALLQEIIELRGNCTALQSE